jgi:integrase
MIEPMHRQRRKTLTDKKVRDLPRKSKRYVVSDPEQRGMYVRVPPQGPNIFVAVARDPYGRQVWATIGSADVLTIEQARDKAREAIRRTREGKPAFEPARTVPDAFKAVAESWLVRHVAATGLRSQAEIERCLSKYVYPRWADRPFTELRRGDVTALLDKIEDEHGPRQADLVLAIIRKLMRWQAARTDEYVAPVVPGMKRANSADRKGKRILNDDEIRALWACTDEMGTYGALLKVALLTGQRRAKVATLRWDDLIDGEWRIRTERREKGNAGTLRLPAAVLDIITAQSRIAGNPHVFPAAVGVGPFNSFSQRKEELDAKLCAQLPAMAPWVVHDLRRTARSLLSRAGVSSDHAERVLGHSIPGVEGIYDRHPYRDEIGAALAKLAALIEAIINRPAGNVLPMRQKST